MRGSAVNSSDGAPDRCGSYLLSAIRDEVLPKTWAGSLQAGLWFKPIGLVQRSAATWRRAALSA